MNLCAFLESVCVRIWVVQRAWELSTALWAGLFQTGLSDSEGGREDGKRLRNRGVGYSRRQFWTKTRGTV